MKLYRKMFADSDGKPLVGDGRNMLGVRPTDPTQTRKGADVRAVSGSDLVKPGEGLSAYDDSDQIPPQVQGEMWVLETDELQAELVVVQKGKNKRHFHITLDKERTLDEFQALLEDTRDLWDRDDGGTNP